MLQALQFYSDRCQLFLSKKLEKKKTVFLWETAFLTKHLTHVFQRNAYNPSYNQITNNISVYVKTYQTAHIEKHIKLKYSAYREFRGPV